MAKKDKRLWIDMCAGSELKDTQGETLSVEGADINDLELGKGRFNDNHGKGFFNSLGRVTEARKILKAEDCTNDREKYYWEKIKAPYVYAKGYLYNDEDHPNARAAAAIIRNIHREDAPLAMKASVEGGVISRGLSDPTRLARTKIHSVALTFTPANNATLVEPLSVNKSDTDWETDKQLIKSVMHLAETDVPSFRHIERHASAHTIHDNIFKIQELAKSLGIDIEVKGGTPKDIMEKAVMHKIASNVCKINELIKAELNPAPKVSSEAVSPKPKVNYLDAPIGAKFPTNQVSTKMRTMGTAKQVANRNLLTQQAMKIGKNPAHADEIHSNLVGRGLTPERATAIIDHIKSHSPDLNKGIVSGAKKVAALGALVAAVNSSVDESKVKTPKTKEATIREHNAKVKDPDTLLGPNDEGYDQIKIGSKKKWLNRRKKKQKRERIKKGLKKALTAGYGGAGVPTGNTGGGVLQPEGLDDGRKYKKSETTDGISYISCDSCGHEQAYMSHQVKCRDCGKNFSLSKLESHM